ncbi:MAG: hypothetical protein UX25_C0042G0008 [Candidatus Woesebacteria bacterium GW2011_GWC2_45_9]|uniref:REase AHJR-like domain-containing protein n=2 Tax=Microgenomates group TaxID=1794810 RepID=A0A0G1N6L2_9BACT|nr:MAG: hypothetical protein UW61_C0013G0003 [Candidatus Curtissbacteria bacterium GW2011_GWC1_44_33]KKU16151.1 MAG: hypothetical protein UX25_C0042G0008 [Candidatus Woesebacteria bacterium GW2011_GWC2_45_9]
MDEHQKLVNLLIGALQKDGYEVLRAVGANYPDPYTIGRHEPDIIARDSTGLLVIGEAKTHDDISSERSQQQYLDFSSRVMSEGMLKGRPVPLHIIVPEGSSNLLRQTLSILGLSTKIGSKIFIWVE